MRPLQCHGGCGRLPEARAHCCGLFVVFLHYACQKPNLPRAVPLGSGGYPPAFAAATCHEQTNKPVGCAITPRRLVTTGTSGTWRPPCPENEMCGRFVHRLCLPRVCKTPRPTETRAAWAAAAWVNEIRLRNSSSSPFATAQTHYRVPQNRAHSAPVQSRPRDLLRCASIKKKIQR